jgi:uncharacterized damage-inducible protein DinB
MRIPLFPLATAFGILVFGLVFQGSAPPVATEYGKHIAALRDLTVAVAEAMPAEKYDYKPHPDSMTFGDLMIHIAQTDDQFCHGLMNETPPPGPTPRGKEAIVQALGDTFAFCSTAINHLTAAQLDAIHDSPDGKLPGRELLLAMFVHVAHHRGQAEVSLRNNGIVPPRYRI